MAHATRTTAAGAALAACALALPLALAPAPAAAATTCAPSGEAGVERCTTGLPAGLLGRMQQTQRASNWCWAATVSIVLSRYGVRVPQEQVVRAQFGSAVNLGVPAQAVSELLSRTWRDDTGRTVHASAAAMPGWRQAQGVLAPEVLQDLDGGRPLVVGAQRHAVVLVQVVYDRATARPDVPLRLVRGVVLDPAADVGGLRSLRPEEQQPSYLARVQVEVPPDEGVRVAEGTEGTVLR